MFYVLVGWIWNAITRMFITSVLPIYANVFSGGKKFLIRFSEYQLYPTSTRTELFRATRKMSLTAVFVLVFLISLVAQSNIGMVTEGNIPDAMVCQDGTVDLLGLCDEGRGAWPMHAIPRASWKIRRQEAEFSKPTCPMIS